MPETIRLEIAHHLEGTDQKVATAIELDLSIDGHGSIAAYLSTEDNARRVQLALDKITATLNWHQTEEVAGVRMRPAPGDHGGACIAHEEDGYLCGCGACIYSA